MLNPKRTVNNLVNVITQYCLRFSAIVKVEKFRNLGSLGSLCAKILLRYLARNVIVYIAAIRKGRLAAAQHQLQLPIYQHLDELKFLQTNCSYFITHINKICFYFVVFFLSRDKCVCRRYLRSGVSCCRTMTTGRHLTRID